MLKGCCERYVSTGIESLPEGRAYSTRDEHTHPKSSDFNTDTDTPTRLPKTTVKVDTVARCRVS